MRKTVAGNPKRRAGRENPDVDKVEDGSIVAKIEQEVVPGPFLVFVPSERQKIERLQSVRHMDPSEIRDQII